MLNPSKRRSRRVFVFIHTPGSLTGICAVDVTQLAEAEAITSRWVDITIHSHYRTAGGHLEHLPHLNVHFKVGDRAPKLWSCNENSKLCEALTANKTLFFQHSNTYRQTLEAQVAYHFIKGLQSVSLSSSHLHSREDCTLLLCCGGKKTNTSFSRIFIKKN